MFRARSRLHGSCTRGVRLESTTALNSLDAKWRSRWLEMTENQGLNPKKHAISPDAPSFYSCSMFPYPSGILHLGHVRVYTISDVLARFKRLQGYNVIHPMGWDAFGLPAENAAVERGINPAVWTHSNIGKMKEQMSLMLADFDWERELTTCSPEYYKWTQKIFLLLYEHGLAYKKEAEINWDPVDETVLANEQVDGEGRSWRSGALVEKRNLSQWFMRITAYAKALDDDMKLLDEWPSKVKLMQKNWIGQSHGANISFVTTHPLYPLIEVFTSRPDTLFSVQFLALSLKHPLVKEAAESDQKLQEFLAQEHQSDSKDGYCLKLKVSLPITPEGDVSGKFDVPVYAAPYVLDTYGSGAVMGCPAHDERDYEFWKLHNPNIAPVVTVAPKDLRSDWTLPYTGKDGFLYDNSTIANGVDDLKDLRGLSSKDAAARIVASLESHGLGEHTINFKIRDWLISRQRYWGAPIPVVYCDNCGTVPVPDEQLPVVLPTVEGESFGKGNPLGSIDSFVNTTCPSCGGHAKRDTDTMDTFMDSSWYLFRYLDSQNDKAPFAFDKASRNMPVDMYIGGVEHAIMHLLYTRFISKFLADAGLWEGAEMNNEPIKQLVTQGMVQGKTYSDPDTKKFLKPEEIDTSGPQPVVKATGKTPHVSYEKMSKSKHNGVDPQYTISKHGADATRAHLLFQAPIHDALNYNEDQIQGVERWLKKVLALAPTIARYDAVNTKYEKTAFSNIELNGISHATVELAEHEVKLFNEANAYLDKIERSINVDLSFNTVISDLMKYTNALVLATKSKEAYHKDLLVDLFKKLLVIMSTITPCVAEEAWEVLAILTNTPWTSVLLQSCPNPQSIESSVINYNVFVNGKARLAFKAGKGLISEQQSSIIDKILQYEDMKKFLSTDKINKVILKPGLISIITQR